MPKPDGILIAGGYGTVGRLIVARIAPQFAGRVWIAGRNGEKAQELCRSVGYGTRPRILDVEDPAALESALAGIGTVMACVAQRSSALLHAAAARGLAYTDISPRLAFGIDLAAIERTAVQSGAHVLLGTGLSPGISNVMAAQLARELGAVDTIETAILLSFGDSYGPDSMRHVFESLEQPFEVHEEGSDRRAYPFREPRTVAFPAPIGPRKTYIFPWSDVVGYPKTLGARSAVGRFALEPAWLARTANALAGARLLTLAARALRRRDGSQGLHWLKQRYAAGSAFALVVEARAAGHVRRMGIAGRVQARITADAAAEMLRMLAAGEITQQGLYFAEQVVDPERFFVALASYGWHVRVL